MKKFQDVVATKSVVATRYNTSNRRLLNYLIDKNSSHAIKESAPAKVRSTDDVFSITSQSIFLGQTARRVIATQLITVDRSERELLRVNRD